MNNLTQNFVKEILYYDSETGVFLWKHRDLKHFKSVCSQKKWNTRYAGMVAGDIDGKGYWRIAINRRRYIAHRVAWLYVYGHWPKQTIDHIDGDRLNNRIENLRDVSYTENNQNARYLNGRKDNNCGFLGVTKCNDNKYHAKIWRNKKTIHLGYHDTPEEAHKEYLEMKRKLHSGFML